MTKQRAFALKEFLLGIIIAGAVGALFFHVITAHKDFTQMTEKNISEQTSEDVQKDDDAENPSTSANKDCDKTKLVLSCDGKYSNTMHNGRYDAKVTCKIYGCHPDVIAQVAVSQLEGGKTVPYHHWFKGGSALTTYVHSDGSMAKDLVHDTDYSFSYKNVGGTAGYEISDYPNPLRGCSMFLYSGSGSRTLSKSYTWIKGNGTNQYTIPDNKNKSSSYGYVHCCLWYPESAKHECAR